MTENAADPIELKLAALHIMVEQLGRLLRNPAFTDTLPTIRAGFRDGTVLTVSITQAGDDD